MRDPETRHNQGLRASWCAATIRPRTKLRVCARRYDGAHPKRTSMAKRLQTAQTATRAVNLGVSIMRAPITNHMATVDGAGGSFVGGQFTAAGLRRFPYHRKAG